LEKILLLTPLVLGDDYRMNKGFKTCQKPGIALLNGARTTPSQA
jgi:hypothetical protein